MSEGRDSGKVFKEFVIFRDYTRDLSLLEHYFGDKDVVGIFCAMPRKIFASVSFVEREDGFLECIDVGRR